jgi:dTDP-4-dehydrorhamnose reductase
MLGSAIYPYFIQRCRLVRATDLHPQAEWLKLLDVRDRAAMEEAVMHLRPDLILHLAAETNLERCEVERDLAEDTNVMGSRIVAELAKRAGATLVYVSTAGVFDGEKEGFYTEDDEPAPRMVYGDTKLRGEQWVREICTKSYVVRAGWMVGGGPGLDKKFVRKVLAQIHDGADVIHAVNDKWGTPTYTHDFAMNLFLLLEREAYGTYHMVCSGSGTRYDVACEIVKICGRSDIHVNPVPSDFFAKEYFAFRPRSEMMTNLRLRELGIDRMRPWHVALRDYVESQYANLCQPAKRLVEYGRS